MSFILVALWSIQEVWVYDSKFYHIQAIKWIEEYGTVVGLGNLFDRLANNNSNFLVSAYFNNSFFNLPISSGNTPPPFLGSSRSSFPRSNIS